MKVETVESRAEVYLMALRLLSKTEKDMVIARLREDILDLALIHQRRGEPYRAFQEYLAQKSG